MKNLDYNGEQDGKGSLLSIVLITVIIAGFFLVWSFFFAPKQEPNQKLNQNTSIETASNEATNQTLDKGSENATSKESITKDKTQISKTVSSQKTQAEIKNIYLSNKNIKIGFSTLGAVIIDAKVRIHDELFSGNIEEKSTVHRTGETYFKQKNNDLELEENQQKVYSVLEQKENTVIFQFVEDGIVYQKKYQLLKDYQVKLSINVFNKDSSQVANPVQNVLLVNGSGIGVTNEQSNDTFNQVMLSKFYNDELEETLKVGFLAIFSRPKPLEKLVNEFPLNWVSLDNRFFARILKAPNNQKTVFVRKAKVDSSYDYIAAQQFSTKNEVNATFYYLPKSRNLMDYFYNKNKDAFYHLFHQYNITRILSTLMYKLLIFINSFIDSFGWSIILLTLIVKLMVLPLTNKSMKSMKKMAELAPQINAIKQQNKKNPQKVQLETMALYKKNKVNPISGCLPILLTIPIFISLYSLFQNMVELKGISFYWIEDLAISESIFRFSFSLPLIGNDIHLLPIVMTLTSLAQSLLTPSQKPVQSNNEDSIAASQQKIAGMMKYYMPVMFLFISWNMPSALVLYWSCQNIFSLIQTVVINKNNYKLFKK